MAEPLIPASPRTSPAMSSSAEVAGDDQHPEPPSDWTRCRCFMPNKRRFCRSSNLVPPPPNSSHEGDEAIYCGNHAHLYDAGMASPNNSGIASKGSDSEKRMGKKGKRIPCPIDPSHEVYESRLEKHLSVCPAATRKQDDVALPFYREKINCGGFGRLSSGENGNGNSTGPPTKRTRSNETNDTDATNSSDRKGRAVRAREMALQVLNAYDTLFLGEKSADACESPKLTPERIQRLSALTFNDLLLGIPTEDLADAEFNAGLQSTVSAQKIRAGGPKHLRQIGSLVGHLRQQQLLSSISGKIDDKRRKQIDTVLEMGAGRGMTGLVAAGVLSASNDGAKLIMVERAGTRGKADTTIRRAIEAKRKRDDSNGSEEHSSADKNEYLDLTRVQMARIKCDLAHVHLPTALKSANGDKSQSSKQSLLVVAKHLCGAGTDLALKSLQPISHRVAGCVFATCCHGVCNWNDYVGRDYLLKLFANNSDEAFGELEFNLMKKWGAGSSVESTSSTGTAGSDVANDKEDEEEKHKSCDAEQDTSDYPEKLSSVVCDLGLACGTKGVGRACQRLIDYGRVEFMKHVLFNDGIGAGSSGERVPTMKHYADPNVTPQNALLCSTCRS